MAISERIIRIKTGAGRARAAAQPGRETPERQAPDRAALDRLLLAAGQGDRAAFAGLYEAARGAVYAAALGMLRDPHAAQDLCQDAFVRIWESAPRYRSEGSPMAWMLTITRNLARMALRGAGRQQTLTEEEWAALPGGGEPKEDALVLREALQCLDAEERQVILLHAVSGLKHREIAALMERPLSTILSKYQRGLKKLKNRLKGDAYQ